MVLKATVSLPLKISLVCLAAGVFVFFIGFGGYNWTSGSISNIITNNKNVSFRVGLWIVCMTLDIPYTGETHSMELCSAAIPWNDPTGEQIYPRDWMMATRATACLAVIALTACVISVIGFLITNNRILIIVSCAAAFATCLLAIVTSVVIARDISNEFDTYVKIKLMDYKLDWAFAFNIVSAIFFFASGVCDVIYMPTVGGTRRLPRPTAAA